MNATNGAAENHEANTAEPKPIYWVWTRRTWSTRGKVHTGVQVHEFDTKEKQERFIKNTTKHVTEHGTR